MSNRQGNSYDKVLLARDTRRPRIDDYIDALFDEFFEQRGDRAGTDDQAICGGIGFFHGEPVTIIGHRKGRTTQENVACNFGMPGPEGYRKAMRLMKEAEHFQRPILTFIDTPGAYPGMEAEANGQSRAIAESLAMMSALTVPVIVVVTGEGNSGGALAIGVGDRIFMMENAVYSILSPEGFATILWKDSSKSAQACDVMGLTAERILAAGFIDGIIPEPEGGIQNDPTAGYEILDTFLSRELTGCRKIPREKIAQLRYEKFRQMGRAAIGQTARSKA